MYDTTTRAWSRLPDMNVGRSDYPGAVAVQRIDGPRIYVFGGDGGKALLDSCEFLDVDGGQWNLIESTMARPRCSACAVLLDNGTVVICGGRTCHDSANEDASCERFDLINHTFSSFPSMIRPRACHAGVHYNGTIVVMGGYGGIDEQSACEQFDPDLFKWTPLGFLNFNRTCFGAAVVGGVIYVAGDDTYMEVYDGSAWNVISASIPYRAYVSVVACDGKVVIVGGIGWRVDVYDPSTQRLADTLNPIPTDRLRLIAVSF